MAQMRRQGALADVDDHPRMLSRVGVMAHRDLVLILRGARRVLRREADATECNQRHQRRAGHQSGNGSRSFSLGFRRPCQFKSVLPTIEAGNQKNMRRSEDPA